MTEPTTPDNHAAGPNGAGSPGWGERVLRTATVVLVTAVLAWVACLLAGYSLPGAQWVLPSLAAGVCVLVLASASAWRHRYWARPMNRLLQMLPDVREGQAPIEILSEVGGGPAPLIPRIQELLHELRKQRAEISRMEFEMGQRVASRTDALERALGSLREKAARDPLTGLYNRRMLDEHLPRMIERRKADKQALSLMMIDVDHFKLLNDTLGHAAGDELLRSIGQLIRSSIRESDAAFRCGGDEFVIVLDACDAEAAPKLAERLAELVDGLVKPLRLAKPPRLSIGVSRLSDVEEATPSAMLAHADRLLYEVKMSRRASRTQRKPVTAA